MASIVAPQQNNANEDAEALHKAVKGWGTDERVLITILGRRNAAQRKQIRQAYENLHQEDLIKSLESELSGDFERAMHHWILEPADRNAMLANMALKKLDNNGIAVIIEIACTYSPEELLAVRRAYQARYKHSLEEDLASHAPIDLRKLLIALVTAYRYDGEDVDQRIAISEAQVLHKALKDKAFEDEELIRILSTRSKAQLRATFNCYKDEHTTSAAKFLGETSDGLTRALQTTIRCIKDPTKYFEKVLRNSMKGLGTDQDALTRVIVTRAEKDLRDIKESYQKRNNESLEQSVANDTSGDYKALLLVLLGKEG